MAWALALASLPGVWPGRLREVVDSVGPEEGFARARRGDPVCPSDDPQQRSPGPQPDLEPPRPSVIEVPALFPEPPSPAPPSLIERRRRRAAEIDVAEVWSRHREWAGSVALLGDPTYPREVAADRAAPAVLCWIGDVGVLAGPRVGIVGTRRCTGYGRDVARKLGEELASAGVAVVSGLAWGIDGSAHEGALRAGFAPPVAVVGSGLDHVYPRRHRELWARVARAGVVMSEWPLGVRPAPWRFPARNRIIAGLSPVLVVVESHATGGSLTTANEADARGHDVMAVPGPLTSPASAGTNDLLAESAHMVRGTADVLTALHRVTPGVVGPRTLQLGGVGGSGETSPLLDALAGGPATLDDLVVRTHQSLDEVAAGLARLEAAGLVGASGGWWEVRAK